ncbi:MAG: ATP-binding protein [Solirubrobacterales bacterium]
MALLPSGASALTISSFDDCLREGATCDLKRLGFVDAYGLMGLACALETAPSDADIHVDLPSNQGMRNHLTRMGMREYLSRIGSAERLPSSPPFEESEVVVPLRTATEAGGEQALANLLWAQLREHVDPQVLQAISEGVWEMVGNALEHSGADALLTAHVYREVRGGRPPHHDDRVQVVIGDTGRGILGSFVESGSHSPRDDTAAIDLALEYLVTSVLDDPGRGQGLSTTMEQVIGLRGMMVVRSGAGKVTIDNAGERRREAVPNIPGVMVALSLPLYPG